jgi:2,3-bisphosphoglycerate-independent phosphoglycerate mutase
MKYGVLIVDGASGWPLEEYGGKTCLELAETPNLDAVAAEGLVGLAQTVPAGMEPSSACACMSLLGYDPEVYYRGRAAIEAVGMGIPIGSGEVVFRCNLVAVRDGRMWSYSSGHISSQEATRLIEALNHSLGSDDVCFHPGIGYRHLLKLKGHQETLKATCTPPHNIPGGKISDFIPHGPGSEFLRQLMEDSEAVLNEHPVNVDRQKHGDIPATMIWLFWGSSCVPDMPAFEKVYGLRAALTSGVDLLGGLGQMMAMDILDIPGVTDGMDNDFAGQTMGALKSLDDHDMAVVHMEAPDEAGHVGSIEEKVRAIEVIDREAVARLRTFAPGGFRLLIMPDHSTPVKVQAHIAEPVPFVLWGPAFTANGAGRLTEAGAKKTGLFFENGYNIMSKLVGR